MRQVRFFDRAHNSCPAAEGIQSRITELTVDSFDSTSDELLIERDEAKEEETIEAATRPMKNATRENLISLPVNARGSVLFAPLDSIFD